MKDPFCKLRQTRRNAVLAVVLVLAAVLIPRYWPAKSPSQIQKEIAHEAIRVESPVLMEKTTGTVEIKGEARGYWFFEASFPVEIVDEQGNQLVESYATAEGEWMTEEFVPFSTTLEFEAPKEGLGTVMLRRDNPSGLAENDDHIGIPIQFGDGSSFAVEEFATNLEIPWDMAFTSEDRMLVTERNGRLRVIENGELKAKALHTFDEVSSKGEEGLMSIALDPDYKKNKWIYLSMAYPKGREMKVKVVRFTDEGSKLKDETVILDDLPAARFHAGCRLRFGPDEKLYITVGDALNRANAQNLGALEGKLLRINKDGSFPNDNPFDGSPIWTYGHRNSQGLAWHPKTDELYSTEHGPSIFDGAPGGDEVNLIKKGANYGWPLVSHGELLKTTEPSILHFTPAEPPGSLMIYSGKDLGVFKHNLFFGSLGGEGLIRIVLDENGNPFDWEKMFAGMYGRIRNVIEGPDGHIYFSTSNRDGRGDPLKKDDRIMRIRSN